MLSMEMQRCSQSQRSVGVPPWWFEPWHSLQAVLRGWGYFTVSCEFTATNYPASHTQWVGHVDFSLWITRMYKSPHSCYSFQNGSSSLPVAGWTHLSCCSCCCYQDGALFLPVAGLVHKSQCSHCCQNVTLSQLVARCHRGRVGRQKHSLFSLG